MSTLDPRTPVIVGVGQIAQRPDDPAEALEPIELLASAARLADRDSGARRSLLAQLDTIAVADMLSWRYPDPGIALARALGVDARDTITSTAGGNTPQLFVNTLAEAVQRGERRAVLIGGAEAVYTRWRARREPKTWLDWSKPDDPPCTTVLGDPRPGTNDYEMAHLAALPTQIYPLFETAVRSRAGRNVEEHQQAIGKLWAPFSVAAASNPHAWTRTAFSAADIITPSADNRIITFPYTKRMCANIDVDQAAALLLCSYEFAQQAGVDATRMVFPVAGATAHDHHFFTERWSLAESPAIMAAADATFVAAGIGLDDVARFDLYSCFPSAVQVGQAALGLQHEQQRPLTVTGGLSFAGGPGNNYATHSIAAMVDACRTDPGSLGLVTALGWYITKHSLGLYSTSPPQREFRAAKESIDATPRREAAGAYEGDAVVEATAVSYERSGTPSYALISALTPDGRRALANAHDVDTLGSMVTEAWEGRTIKLRSTDAGTNALAV